MRAPFVEAGHVRPFLRIEKASQHSIGDLSSVITQSVASTYHGNLFSKISMDFFESTRFSTSPKQRKLCVSFHAVVASRVERGNRRDVLQSVPYIDKHVIHFVLTFCTGLNSNPSPFYLLQKQALPTNCLFVYAIAVIISPLSFRSPMPYLSISPPRLPFRPQGLALKSPVTIVQVDLMMRVDWN